jgi:metal-responsive CopG/Arc/MetJ family transcriptional regulator
VSEHKKLRRTVDLRKEDIQRLDELAERFGTSNQSETLRRAIKIAHALTEPDNVIQMKDGNGVMREIMFL